MTGQNLIIRSNDISKITSYSIDQTLVRVMAALGAAIVPNAGKVAEVTGAVAALDAQGWSWFGLANEGGGRRNEMSITNGTNRAIELKKFYIYRGKVKIPPEPLIKSMEKDKCLFHNAGSWPAILVHVASSLINYNTTPRCTSCGTALSISTTLITPSV